MIAFTLTAKASCYAEYLRWLHNIDGTMFYWITGQFTAVLMTIDADIQCLQRTMLMEC